ncbi:MAG: hypothetical protein ACE5IW_09410 [bacterium]
MPSFTIQVPNLQDVGPLVEIRFAVAAVFEENLKKNNQPVPQPTH